MPSTPDTNVRDLYDSLAEKGYSDMSGTSSPDPSSPPAKPDGYGHHEQSHSVSVQGVGRAIAGRAARTMRRGNLPFLIVFLM